MAKRIRSVIVKKIKQRGDLDHLRGMGEPLAFEFKTLDRGKSILIHAVIFTSYEVSDRDREIKIATPEGDPRMAAFMNFCMKNYAIEERDRIQGYIDSLVKEIADARQSVAELQDKLKKLEAPKT